MSLRARLALMLRLGIVVAALGGGVAAGVALGTRASAPVQTELVLADPALATPAPEAALRSAGGFTGFDGAAALGGAVTRVGAIAGTRDGSFEVTGAGSTLAIRTTSTARLYRVRRAASPLRPGDTVVVLVGADGSAAAVLRVPADLNEGARPAPTPTGTGTPAR